MFMLKVRSLVPKSGEKYTFSHHNSTVGLSFIVQIWSARTDKRGGPPLNRVVLFQHQLSPNTPRHPVRSLVVLQQMFASVCHLVAHYLSAVCPCVLQNLSITKKTVAIITRDPPGSHSALSPQPHSPQRGVLLFHRGQRILAVHFQYFPVNYT